MIQVFDHNHDKNLFQIPEAEFFAEGFDFSNRWVHLSNPTDKEIEFISRCCSIPEEMIKAALDEEERPHIERENDIVLTVTDIPIIEEEDERYEYSTLPFGFITTNNIVVSVCINETTLINDFIYGRVKNVSVHKRTRFLLQFLYRASTKYLQYLKQIDKTAQRIQAELEKSMRNKELIEMLALETSLVYFSTSLHSNSIVLEKLPKITEMYEEDKDLWEDLGIENKQAIEMCNIYRDIFSSTMDAYASLISNNLNIVMKLLTLITILISVPTLIASLWGMNTGVPWQGKPYGFWIVLGISLVSCIVTGIVMFKKKMFK
jgi:magnesium transporter